MGPQFDNHQTTELREFKFRALNVTTTKRKYSFDGKRTVKRVHFMNGSKTEYICQEDFVSEEAWNRFLRYSAYQQSTAAVYSKKSHSEKNLTGVTDGLDRRGLNGAKYLKILPSHLKQLITHLEERKSTALS